LAKKKKWIQSAGLKKGAFTDWCKEQGFSGPTSECIAAGKKSKNPTTRKRANLAETFKGMHKKGKRD